MAGEFLTDIETLRQRAREHIERGAVTQGYKADLSTVIRLLNEALATELVCILRYKRHFYMANGINAQSVAQEFLQHATDEQLHADQLAARIVQLGGAPNFSPEGLSTRSHSEYVEGESLVDMIREGPGGRAGGHRFLRRDGPLYRGPGPHHPAHAGGDPGRGGGACR